MNSTRPQERNGRLLKRNALALSIYAALGLSAASAQTVTVPAGTYPSYANTATGTAGGNGQGLPDHPQNGGPGQNTPALTVNFQSGVTITGGGSGTTVNIGLTGGAGGIGNDAAGHNGGATATSDYGADGGVGGTPQLLQFLMSTYTTVNSSTTAPFAASIFSLGGVGGFAGGFQQDYGYAGTPGAGGAGGDITANLGGSFYSSNGWNGATPGTTALLISSVGGNGGENPNPVADNSGSADQDKGSAQGKPGGAGGDGGNIQVVSLASNVYSATAGMVLVSQGGNGSDGSKASATGGTGTGGAGGAGGSGGMVQLTIGDPSQPTIFSIRSVGAATAATGADIPVTEPDQDGNQTYAKASYPAAAIQLQSLGGNGGPGGAGDGASGTGGAGGASGSGGPVTLGFSAFGVATSGFAAPGVVAQSVGGSGGTGSDAGGTFKRKGGSGGVGGNGGTVNLNFFDWNGATQNSVIQTLGDDSAAVIGQSVGGGGGVGGSVSVAALIGSVAVGGQGESGGQAGTVTITNGDGTDPNDKPDAGIVISTAGTRASGIVAQSIGGGGGTGGSAQSTVIGPFAYAVGGNGGGGGNAGTTGTVQVQVTNAGIVSTLGDHSRGIEAQAIGGGGGSGGSASTLTANAALNVNVTVGGQGGAGGSAGDVTVQNDGQIVTQGSDAWGMVVQSIGGGGGNGGASKSEAFQLVASNEVPSLEVAVAIGGKGTGGGSAGNVTAGNSFSIMTGGDGAHGIVAQSIGGGGGNGGDSHSLLGSVKGSTFSFNLSIGGVGGSGNGSGQVMVNNEGLIWTMGTQSNAVLAQSIAGGGGNGGLGNADTSAFTGGDKTSLFEFGIGGAGANGADANLVTVNNSSGVLTTGDGSDAILAQSIGGGGGNGGGAVANGTAGTVNMQIAVGGKGGSGGNGGDVKATNLPSGAIMTTGGEAAGIFAQSIGGAGGKGGSGTVGGGVNPVTLIKDYLSNGSTSSKFTQQYGNDITKVEGWGEEAKSQWDTMKDLRGLADDYIALNSSATPDADGAGGGSFSVTLNVGAGQSGNGGSGGRGGSATATNEGQILTLGPASPGIHAQSVGGGGGKGGALSVANNTSYQPNNVTGTINIGGRGGAAGDGGLALVTNLGQVTTQGDQSHGMIAQSIGGGGGMGNFTATQPVIGVLLQVGLGGDGGVNGDGGGYADNIAGASVDNYNLAATVPGASIVTTLGDDAVGLVAQNIGGGGGVMSVMHTGTDANGAAISQSSQASEQTQVAFALGASTRPPGAGCGTDYLVATCGQAGEAYVNSDTVSTAGRNAHGVVAQSIGGGGGWLVGGSLTGNNFFANTATSAGNGGPVQVYLHGPTVTTGDGAIGVIAQSIGGGGLLGGDIAMASSSPVARPIGFQPTGTPSFFLGNGGEVDVNVVAGGSITTSGQNAHGIYAQSVGGGGGFVVSDKGWIDGSGGGIGSAGPINVQIDGSVTTNGVGAIGVYANTAGSDLTNGQIGITVTGSVTSNQSDAIVVNSSASGNTVTNSGTIWGAVGRSAVSVGGPGTAALNVTNRAGGSIYGNVALGGGTLTNAGSWFPDGANNGNVASTGLIAVAQGRPVSSTIVLLNGNLQHSGILQTTADFAQGQANKLFVEGNADLTGSQISLIPTSTGTQPVTIVHANGTLTLGQNTVYDDGQLGQFSYQLSTPDATTLQVTQQSQMAAVASKAGLSRTEQGVARHLDVNFAAGTPGLGDTFHALGRIDNLPQFRRTLDSLANEAVNAVGNARLATSQAFATRMNSCPDFEGSGTYQIERECAWGRVIGDWTDRDTTSDSLGYTVDSKLLQFGGQKQRAPGWFLGGSIAYDWSDYDADSVPAQVDGQGVTVGAVLKREDGPWLFSAAVDAGYGWYDSTRTVSLSTAASTATASFNGQHAGLHGRIAYQLPQQDWYLKPYVDLHAIYQRTAAYTETGAGALDLSVDSNSVTRLVASPMLELGGRFDLDAKTVLKPVIGIGGSFFNKNEWNTQVRFAGSPSAPFEVNASLPSALFNLNLGVTLMRGDNLHLRLDYSGQFGSDYRSNGGSLKLIYLF